MPEENQDLESGEAVEKDEQVSNKDESDVPEGTDTSETEEKKDSDQQAEADQEAKSSQENKKSAQFRVSNRIRKLREETKNAQTEKDQTAQKLAIAEEKAIILQIALDQKKGGGSQSVIPNPDNFDNGVHDPEYIKKYQEYLNTTNQEQIRKQVMEVTDSIQQTAKTDSIERDNERNQRDHYKRALDRGNSDYEKAEDLVLSTLGSDALKNIINNFQDDSELIIYRLGKDNILLEEVAEAISSNQHVLVVRLLERASGADFKPKTKNKITPDPDKPLSGGSPSSGNDTDVRAAKLLDKASESGSKADLDKYLDHMASRRKEAQKAKAG